MKTEDIKILIQAFYQGETTVEEEQKLLHYFGNEDVPDELSEEKELFLRLYQSEAVETPENLESKLNSLIDQLAEKEEKKLLPKTKRLWIWTSAAACIIVLIVSSVIMKPEIENLLGHQNQHVRIITDPEEAAIEAQKALALMSENFNKGTNQLALVSTNVEKVNQLVEKQFKTINNHGKNNEN